MVPTRSQRERLAQRGFRNLVLWARGVDTAIFNPMDPVSFELPRPWLVYMGRVASEKNIEAFLDLELPGSKLVVGDGPDLERLKTRHAGVHFTGARFGRELARHLAAADVFVFPSRTDTFGLVLLEAMACGVPVAAYPVQGPVDVIADGQSGALDEDLGRAIARALRLKRSDGIAHARSFSWESSTAAVASQLASFPARRTAA